ncbi:uncharacterized protein LOC105204167 [Solenopsis invicta]|uniref:uncharacterized protein LOC105204167 n=1 Tax=Solenopsis invicta TaxID=13686 RepID=UPI0005962EEA|nr:uncharacterized protein LOC105204167 [Solenopsis invicta]
MACHRLFQTNLNHSARAQDLLVQTIAEWNIELAIVAEPYAVPSANTSGAGASLVLGKRDEGYVACLWGGWAVVGVYVSSNISFENFESKLDEIGGVVRRLHPDWVLVAGDFNAKSADWGSPVSDTDGSR